MPGHGFDVERGEIVDSRAESRRIDKVGSSGLELEWQIGPCRAAEADMTYHLAASLVGRHFFEELTLAVEHSDACRTVHLVR